MRQFEVWQLASRSKNGAARLVMILQSEKIEHITAIIVAPLISQSSDMVVPDLTPSIEIGGTAYTVLVPLMAAIVRKKLALRVFDGSALNYKIGKALDRVFSGV